MRNDLPKDIVLFDRLGNFLGPISEVTGEFGSQRYVIRMEEDSVARMKRRLFKISDYVYYYNCDRLHAENEEMSRELNLIELKRQSRLGHKKPSNLRSQIMNGVIQNLKDLRLDISSKIAEDNLEEDDKNSSKNSRTIISMVMKSHCNPSLVGSAKERQKRKKYKKAKARMFLTQLNELQGAEGVMNHRLANEMDDELMLGKRLPPTINYRKEKPESSFMRSSDYSRNSTDTERKIIPEEEILFKSFSMNEGAFVLPNNFSIFNETNEVPEMNEEPINPSSIRNDLDISNQ